MSYVTQMIENESGIQYQGVSDKTNIDQTIPMTNMLLLVENVPHGRLDQPMTVTHSNKNAILGHEKDNLYLQAVEDALKTNVPSIQVMRVKIGEHSEGCEGAIDIMEFEHIFGTWELYVDDVFIFESKSIGFHQLLLDHLNFLESPNNNNNWYIRNLDNKVHRIKLVPVYDTQFTLPANPNPTYMVGFDGSLTFCLAASEKTRYYSGTSLDLNIPDVNFYVWGTDDEVGTIIVTHPNGQQTTHNPSLDEIVHLGYMEGIYQIHAVDGFTNVIGDVFFKASPNEATIPEPVINSVTRNSNGLVTITGTAKPYSVVRLYSDDDNNDDEPIAYSKILEGETTFSFILNLPANFSGYIRCNDGYWNSPGANFSI